MPGPAEYLSTNTRPRIYKGNVPVLDFPVFDGIPVSGWPNGKPVELSNAGVSGTLKVQNPDGGADYDLAATKVKTSNLAGITSDTFRFTFANGDTDAWTAQLAPFIVEWVHSTGPRTIVIVDGEIDIRVKATDAA